MPLVRVTRFELVSPLWKSGVLPLNDTRGTKERHYSPPPGRGQACRGEVLPGAGNQTRTGVTTMGKWGPTTERYPRARTSDYAAVPPLVKRAPCG